MRQDVRDGLYHLGERIKRMNQVILAFPVWLVLGISGLFRRTETVDGWQDSEKNERWERMY